MLGTRRAPWYHALMTTRISSIDDLIGNLERLDGTRSVPFDQLFPRPFMHRYTNFGSIEEMLEKSGFKVETMEDFAAIPDEEWDRYVNENTRFSSWDEMQERAVEEYTLKELGFR